MDQPVNHDASQTKQLATKAGAALTALVALSVPAFAVSAVLTGGHDLFGGPAIQSADDRVANGLRIVQQPETPSADTNQRVVSDKGAEDVVLQDWRYTGKPNPSPGH
jgi:hypothetical protein